MEGVRVTITYGQPVVKKKGTNFIGEKEPKTEMTGQLMNAYDKKSTCFKLSLITVFHWKNGSALAYESYGICEFHKPFYKPDIDELIGCAERMANTINTAFEESSDLKKFDLGRTVIKPTKQWIPILEKMLSEFNPH